MCANLYHYLRSPTLMNCKANTGEWLYNLAPISLTLSDCPFLPSVPLSYADADLPCSSPLSVPTAHTAWPPPQVVNATGNLRGETDEYFPHYTPHLVVLSSPIVFTQGLRTSYSCILLRFVWLGFVADARLILWLGPVTDAWISKRVTRTNQDNTRKIGLVGLRNIPSITVLLIVGKGI